MSAQLCRPGFWPVRRAELPSGTLCTLAISARLNNHPPANVPFRRRLVTFSCAACTSDTARSCHRSGQFTLSPGDSCRFNRSPRPRRHNRPDDREQGCRRGTPDMPDRRLSLRPRPIWKPRPRADPAARVLAARTPRNKIRVQGVAAQWLNGDRHPTGRPRRLSWVAGSSSKISPKWDIRTYRTPWTPAVSTAITSSIRYRAHRRPRRPRRLRARSGHRCIRSTPSTFPTFIRCTRYNIIRRQGTTETT